MGLKAPSTKHQAPEKPQTPIPQLGIGDWRFSGAWCLVLGAFLIPLAPTCTFGTTNIAPYLEAQSSLQSWSADFVQTRSLKSLKQPLKTPGHLYFVAPNMFRWELGDPTQTIAVRRSNEVLLIYPPLKRAERYALSAGERSSWQDMLSLLEAGFPRNQRELEARFRIMSTRALGGKAQIVLEPNTAGARRWMNEMELVFDAESKSLTATELRFADGSSLRNDFKNQRNNPAVAPELFNPPIPPDYKVTQPGKTKRR